MYTTSYHYQSPNLNSIYPQSNPIHPHREGGRREKMPQSRMRLFSLRVETQKESEPCELAHCFSPPKAPATYPYACVYDRTIVPPPGKEEDPCPPVAAAFRKLCDRTTPPARHRSAAYTPIQLYVATVGRARIVRKMRAPPPSIAGKDRGPPGSFQRSAQLYSFGFSKLASPRK